MTSKTQVAKPRRARTADQKQDRRAAILVAAIACTRESGFDGVTMSGLAKRAGLAKGTLYLYFETREEVFLALYLDALAAWAARIAGFGAGAVTPLAAADALAVARAAEPADVHGGSVAASGFGVGDTVDIQADDYGQEITSGR
ncbi:MAG: TetR/AcrR family transcriptional regulator, partial [Bauldia litoralis]